MANITGSAEHLFIIRIWQEAGQTPTGPWHGTVEHIPSARGLYFASLNDLADFIALRLNGNPQAQMPTGQAQPESSTDKSPSV